MIKTLKKKGVVNKATPIKKAITRFRCSLFSRHPSHAPLRTQLPLMPFRSILRLGSTTPHIGNKVECNSVQSVKNSANKLLMKQCFTRGGIKTADWWIYNNGFRKNNSLHGGLEDINILPYPIIAKSHFGSRGIGNTKLDTQKQLENWMKGKDLSNYIFEKYLPFTREYRLHISDFGCFYTCRKLLRNNTPEGTWQLHDDVVNWALEDNPSFKKPNNWNQIVDDCVRAKNALGLDICAFDVKVHVTKERANADWIILESCSAPSFGDITLQKYLEEIPKVLKKKYEGSRI